MMDSPTALIDADVHRMLWWYLWFLLSLSGVLLYTIGRAVLAWYRQAGPRVHRIVHRLGCILAMALGSSAIGLVDDVWVHQWPWAEAISLAILTFPVMVVLAWLLSYPLRVVWCWMAQGGEF